MLAVASLFTSAEGFVPLFFLDFLAGCLASLHPVPSSFKPESLGLPPPLRFVLAIRICKNESVSKGRLKSMYWQLLEIYHILVSPKIVRTDKAKNETQI